MTSIRFCLIWIIASLIAGCSTIRIDQQAPVESTFVQIPILVSPQDIPSKILVECTIDNVEHVLLKLDTAAPKSSLPSSELLALGLSSGIHDIWLGSKSGGIHVGQRQLASINAARKGPIVGQGIPDGAILRGTLGTDWLRGYAIGIDFQGRSLWVIPRQDSRSLELSKIPRPQNVDSGVSIAALLKNVDPTEGGVLFVNASFDDHGKTGSFLVDTGANTNLALASYWSGVHSASSRAIPLDLADYKGTPIAGAYRMGSAFSMGGRSIQEDVPVWVLDRFPVLDYAALHFQHNFAGLIGLWGIYQNYTVLDYGLPASADDKAARMFLFHYQHTASLGDNEFTGYGITVHHDGPVVKVVKMSDAAKKGVRDGDVLINSSNEPFQIAASGVVTGTIGEVRKFKFKRGNETYEVSLTAENLLRP
jgi:hypothetical protein